MPIIGNTICGSFLSGILNKQFDFFAGTTDTYKIALYTALADLNSNTATYTSANEVIASGYVAGGNVLVISPAPVIVAEPDAINSLIAYFSFEDTVWAANLTARGALIYKDGGAAVAVLDFGTDKTSANNVFRVKFPPVTPTTAIISLRLGYV